MANNEKNQKYIKDDLILEENKYNTKKIKKTNNNEDFQLIVERYEKLYANIEIKKKREIKTKINMKDIIKKKQEEHFDSIVNYAKVYNIYKKINNKISEIIKRESNDIYNTTIGTKETIYMTLEIEGLNKTQISTTNDVCLKEVMNVSSKTFDSRRSKIDNELFLKIIEPLKDIIKEEFGMDIDVFAVDGCKLSLSLAMNKYNYPTARPNTKKKKDLIKKIKQNYKSIISETRKKYNLLLKNNKDLKQEKNKTINDLINEREEKIKTIRNDESLNNDIDDELCDKKNAKYCKCLLTSIFNVKTNMSYMMNVSKLMNERQHIMNMINDSNFIKKGSVFIFDGGYYSEELLNFMLEKGMIPIFRLKHNLDICQKLDKENKLSDEVTINKNIMNLVKYTVDKENFYLLTSDMSLTVDKLKTLYWLRWTVEEFYKKVKHTMKGEFYNVSSDNILKQSIYSQQFVSMYTQIMTLISKKYNINLTKKRKNSKPYVNREICVNFKEALNICVNELLYILFFNKSNTISDIIFILNRISNSTYIKIPNRKYKRIAIRFTSKWYYDDTKEKNK